MGTLDVDVEFGAGVTNPGKLGVALTEDVEVMTKSLQFCTGLLDFSSTSGIAFPFSIKLAALAARMVAPPPPGRAGLGLATKTPGIVED